HGRPRGPRRVRELQRLAGRPAGGKKAPRHLEGLGHTQEPVPDRACARGDDRRPARLALLEGISVRQAPLRGQGSAIEQVSLKREFITSASTGETTAP